MPTTPDKGNILIVDDNTDNLMVLNEILQQAGYRVRAAINGSIALDSAQASPPELVLLDIRMPEMDGYEVSRRLKLGAQTREVPIIFISALQETKDKLNAFQCGGVDYITKPFEAEEVLARVDAHIRLYRMQHHLERVVAERTEELRLAYESLLSSKQQQHDILVETINAIALTVEKRDPYTSGHMQRVSTIAVAIMRALGVDDEQLEGMRLGSLIHDIGKITVPAEILNRPGRLSEVEYTIIKGHAQNGYEIVRDIEFPWPVAEMIHQHHERLDGSGYPQGLKGEAIGLEARVIAVADVAEAMTSHRPYRAALGLDAALDELRQGRGTRYDSEVVDAFSDLVANGTIVYAPQQGITITSPAT